MNILYVQYSNPGAYPVAIRAARLWRARGHDVRFLGLRLADDQGLLMPADLIDVTSSVPHGRIAPIRFAAALARAILTRRPDWLYIADPMAALVAEPVLGLHRGGIAYHEHDSLVGGLNPRADRVWRARNRVARNADLVVLPNADRASSLCADSGRPGFLPTLTVWNTPSLAEVADPKPALATPPPALRIVYAGSINPQRVPMTLVDALAAVPQAELTLIGYETVSSRGWLNTLMQRAVAAGCADRIHTAAPLAYDALLPALREYDVAFVALGAESDEINHRFMVGASNKSFDAMGQGLALLVGPGQDWATVFVEPGYGLACDPAVAQSVASALTRLAHDRTATRAMGECGRDRIATDWAYDMQFAPVIAAMESSTS